MKKHLFIVAAILIFLFSGFPARILGAEDVVQIKRAAVIPFGTVTAGDISIDITCLISDFLIKNEFKVVSQDILEKFLVKRRIRGTEFLDRPVIREMGAVLGTDVLLLGSVEFFEDGENPQITINAQMISCFDGSVIWANSISRTGDDFVTFLGLGRITSLKKLVEITVEELLSSLPFTVNSVGSSVTPVEIIYAGFSPDVLRGGETTRLSIEVREITGRLLDIKAFVFDNEINLKTDDRRWYIGTISAPVIDGVYPLKIYVSDSQNRLFNVDSMASLTVYNIPPQVALSFQKRLVSPNNDGINDYIQFFPELLKAVTLKSWRVEITDKAGNIVRSEDGFGVLPAGFIWRGENNQYRTVKDGTYFCSVSVEDKAGNRTSTVKKKIVVDKTPPEIAVALAGGNEESLTLLLEIKDISEIVDWEIIVYDRTGAEAGRFDGNGNIPATIVCPIKKKSKKGMSPEQENMFTYSLEVRDIAGNRLQIEKQPLKPLKVEVTEVESEKKKDEWVEDF
ncbi:MAG: gliding motility-associated C-terminal domain-containing protein [Deltaproteobacteria bacterium]|nr:gliding motility-associated C-terminal domain-containing protein [Deltaproteobacteria bacterium]